MQPIRLIRRCFSENLGAAAIRRKAIKLSHAPPSIAAIPDGGLDLGNAGAFIRQVGSTRRVFLLNPHLTVQEIEGLAYRIKTLTKNASINSVLIATDDTDDVKWGALPSSVVAREAPSYFDPLDYAGFPPAPGKTWLVAAGYDPLELWRSGAYRNREEVDLLLSQLGQLALATRGDVRTTKVPVITIPHGVIRDGGFALCMGTYVLTTHESSFRILNPSRGLSLDPIGLTFILPRLGFEFDQPASKYVGCGMILALMGYEADAEDMVETGLATHYMDSPAALGLFEETLSQLPPWNQQAILKNPTRYYGAPEPIRDHNAAFRNVHVAHTVHCFTSYAADGGEMWTHDEPEADFDGDPSLETDPVPWHSYRSSDLVNYAYTFDEIFRSEDTVQGIYERFREFAARKTADAEEQEGIDVAAGFVERMNRQSPLALCVVHRLMRMGARKDETLESCMTREKKVQQKLFQMGDFESWARYSASKQQDSTASLAGAFNDWKHKSLADVSRDEIAEIVEQ